MQSNPVFISYLILPMFAKMSIKRDMDGEVAEWSNVPDSKSGVPQGTAGSNPALSAIKLFLGCRTR